MAISSVSPVLPQVLPCRLGNAQWSSRHPTPMEGKATLKSFQGVTCGCSSTNYSLFSKGSVVERHRTVEVRATEPAQQPAPSSSSILCKSCDGNGAVVCTQCKGDGINKEDFFGGHFKAGSICWLCRGKRETLCGDCNGAGFRGGFMSTFEE
eukprot:c37144_g1_i1 orf=230-685(+)